MFTSCTLERSIDLQLPSRSPQVDAKVNTALVEVSAKEWNVSGNLARFLRSSMFLLPHLLLLVEVWWSSHCAGHFSIFVVQMRVFTCHVLTPQAYHHLAPNCWSLPNAPCRTYWRTWIRKRTSLERRSWPTRRRLRPNGAGASHGWLL